jgi:hypothetical protein
MESNKPVEGEPEKREQEPEMAIMPPTEASTYIEQIEKLGFNVYGMLLLSDPNHPLSKAVSDHWNQLHKLTGDKFLLVAFQPPPKLSDSYKDYWKAALGDSFEKVWAEWQKEYDQGMPYDYLGLFDPKLKPSQMPCLALYTDPSSKRAVVRSIPDWDSDSLYKLLTGICWTIRECSERENVTPEERLELLREALTSPGAVVGDYAGHFSDRAIKYLKEHPVEVVFAAGNLTLAILTANILPISPAIVSVLKIVKDTFFGKSK